MEILTHLKTLDVLILAILIFGLLSGWLQGLLQQALGLAAFYVALVLGAQYHRLLAGWLIALFPGALWVAADSLSFLVTFGLATALFTWVSRHIYENTHLPFLSFLDGIGGAIFGFFTACLQVIIGLSVLKFALSVNWTQWEATRQTILTVFRESTLGPLLLSSAPATFDLLKPWLPVGLPAIFSF